MKIKPLYPYLSILVLTFVFLSCSDNKTQRITIEDISATSNRAYKEILTPKNIETENIIAFFDEREHLITSDKFNQKMAEGKYLLNERKNPNGKDEVHLMTLKKYTENLEEINVPSFEIQDLNSNSYDKESLQGKITILSFWFIASGLNVKEMNSLNKLAEKYKDDNTDLIWIAPALDEKKPLSHFLKNKNWVFNFAAEQESLALKFGVLTYPTHLILDKKGNIIKVIVRNENTKETIKNTIKKLLND